MVRALALALWITPALALAQVTVTETSDLDKGDDKIINIQECNGQVASRFAISFKLPTTAGSVSSVDLRISDTSGCPLPSTSNTAKTETLQSFGTTSGSLASRTAQNLVSLLALTCDAGQLKTLFVCAVGVTAGADVSNALQTASIQLDTQTPSAPVGVFATPGDSALDVHWDAVSGATRYKVSAATPPGSGGAVVRDSGIISDTTSFRLGRLTNGTAYGITVVAYSPGLNPSTPSAEVTGTPVAVDDFWRLYRKDGGGEEGGCGTAGAGALSLLALAALALRRRTRRALPFLLVLAAVGAAAPARADTGRYGSFDLRFAPYRPNVDAEFGGAASPYRDIFGGGKKLMIRAQAAWTVYSGFGSVDLGLGAGFWQARGYGKLSTDGTVSGDRTTFRVVPTSLFAAYRLDWLAEQTPWFPLAPYGRVSLERFNWWVTNGGGGVANANGQRGRGATNGWSATAGLAFLLDVIDPHLARELDNDTGINHTYLYAEATKLKVDDFGSKSSFDLSNSGNVMWGFGLMFVY